MTAPRSPLVGDPSSPEVLHLLQLIGAHYRPAGVDVSEPVRNDGEGGGEASD